MMRVPVPVAHSYGWVVVVLCLVAMVPFALFRWGLGVFFPFIQDDLGTSRAELGLIASGLALGAACTALLAGWMVDVVGVRRLQTGALACAAIAVFLFSQIQSPVQGLMLGTLMGVALAVSGPAYTKAMMQWVTPTRRAISMGSVEASLPISGIIAGVLISYLVVTFGWRSVVEVLALGIAISSVVFLVFYRDYPGSGDMDGTERSRTGGRLSLVAGNRDFWVSCLFGTAAVGVEIVLLTYLVLFLTEELDMSTVLAGSCLAVAMAGSAVGRMGWGLVSDLLLQGRRAVTLVIVDTLSVVSMALMALLPSDASLVAVYPLVFFVGCNAIGSSTLRVVLAAELVGPALTGTGLGFYVTVTQVGTFVITPVFGLIVDSTGSYDKAWWSMAGLASAGTLLLAVLRPRA